MAQSDGGVGGEVLSFLLVSCKTQLSLGRATLPVWIALVGMGVSAPLPGGWKEESWGLGVNAGPGWGGTEKECGSSHFTICPASTVAPEGHTIDPEGRRVDAFLAALDSRPRPGAGEAQCPSTWVHLFIYCAAVLCPALFQAQGTESLSSWSRNSRRRRYIINSHISNLMMSHQEVQYL